MKNKRADKVSSGVEVINLLIALREISGDVDLVSESNISNFIFNEETKTSNQLTISR